jgi:hypothetical protein
LLTQTPVEQSQEVLVPAFTMSSVEAAKMHVDNHNYLIDCTIVLALISLARLELDQYTYGEGPRSEEQPPLIEDRTMSNEVKDNEKRQRQNKELTRDRNHVRIS